jgi:hypothetical protein
MDLGTYRRSGVALLAVELFGRFDEYDLGAVAAAQRATTSGCCRAARPASRRAARREMRPASPRVAEACCTSCASGTPVRGAVS